MLVNGAPWVQQNLFNTSQSGDITGYWNNGVSLPGNRGYHGTFFMKDYVYLLGGFSVITTYLQNAVRGVVNSSGVITSWSTVSIFPFKRAHMCVVCTGSYVYVLGGIDSGYATDQILRATVNSDGTLGTFALYGYLPETRSGAKAAIIRNKLYIIGGDGANILMADIDDTGIGTWSVAGTLTNYSYAFLTYTPYKIYFIGGLYTTKIQSAVINPDGTLGTFADDFSLISVISFSCGTCSASNAYTFAGRQSNTSYISDIWKFNIVSGYLTSQDYSAYYLLDARYGHSCVVTSSRVYVLGGINSSNAFIATTEYTDYAGGFNDYFSYLAIPDPAEYNLESSISVELTSGDITSVIINPVNLSSNIVQTTVVSQLKANKIRPIATNLAVLFETSVLYKEWALESTIESEISTQSLEYTVSRRLASNIALAVSTAKVTREVHRAFTSALLVSLTISDLEHQVLSKLASSLQVSFDTTSLNKTTERTLDSTITLDTSTSKPKPTVLRLVQSDMSAEFSTSSIRSPVVFSLSSSIGSDFAVSNVNKSLAYALMTNVSFVVGASNLDFITLRGLISHIGQGFKTPYIYSGSKEPLIVSDYVIRKISGLRGRKLSGLYSARRLPKFRATLLEKYHITLKVTHGITD